MFYHAGHTSSTWLLHFCHHSFWTFYLVVHQPHDVHTSTFCVGCAIVKGDHAPDCGVAQGVVHGVIGHHGKKEEEVEEELGQEVKGQEEENAQTPVRMTMTMDEMEETLRGP